ncbi:hypothetical protein QA641_14805 [Bradyrhizobium sp. CB1650]|nr:hypothetical protein [Bradyrhizobium sp. CB1650]WGD55055.1 hypothetical protein QA641_14805 [Bradyrhizobium sp. CB1650]
MRFAVTRAALPHRPIEVSAATFFVVCASLVILCATSRSAAGD